MTPPMIRLPASPVPLKKAKLDQRMTVISQHTLPSGLVILSQSEMPLAPTIHEDPSIPLHIPPWQGKHRPCHAHLHSPTPVGGFPPEGILAPTLLADAVSQRLSASPPGTHSQGTMPNVSFGHSLHSPTHAPAELAFAHPSTLSTNAPVTSRPGSPVALFQRDQRHLFGASSTPRQVPMPYSTFSLSREPLSNQRRAPSGVSHRTQTDPLNIKATALVRPILRGLV